MPHERRSSDLTKLSEGLIEDIARWVPELETHGFRPTLWFGIMSKCITEVEQILHLCVQELLSITGDAGRLAVRKVGGNKSRCENSSSGITKPL